jgi:hypothetical protein
VFSTFLQNERIDVIYIFISKADSFQNYSGVLCRLFQEKGVKALLISNVTAGKVTLCYGQHFARDLRVEPADVVCTFLVSSNLRYSSGFLYLHEKLKEGKELL